MELKKIIGDVNIEDFKDVDVVCDLNGIPNDPASELNKKLTWKINYQGRKNFAKTSESVLATPCSTPFSRMWTQIAGNESYHTPDLLKPLRT